MTNTKWNGGAIYTSKEIESKEYYTDDCEWVSLDIAEEALKKQAKDIANWLMLVGELLKKYEKRFLE